MILYTIKREDGSEVTGDEIAFTPDPLQDTGEQTRVVTRAVINHINERREHRHSPSQIKEIHVWRDEEFRYWGAVAVVFGRKASVKPKEL